MSQVSTARSTKQARIKADPVRTAADAEKRRIRNAYQALYQARMQADPVKRALRNARQVQWGRTRRDKHAAAFILFVKQHRSQCVRCSCSNPLAIELNHIDPSKKLFELNFDEFISKKGYKSSPEWLAELAKVESLCRCCHCGVTHDDINEASAASLARPDPKFKKGKACVCCGIKMKLLPSGNPTSAELARFELDHISRTSKTGYFCSQKASLIDGEEAVHVLCSSCHALKTACESYRIFGTELGKMMMQFVPDEFVKWFDRLTEKEDWPALRERQRKRSSNGRLATLDREAKRVRIEEPEQPEQPEAEPEEEEPEEEEPEEEPEPEEVPEESEQPDEPEMK